MEEEKEEKRLTDLFFGGSSGIHDHGYGGDEENVVGETGSVNANNEDGDTFFEIDRIGTTTPSQKDNDDGDDTDDDEDDQRETVDHNSNEDNDSESQAQNAGTTSAWIDEDENLAISFDKSSNRVKKLRNYMTEDVVDGADYGKRLRERFQATSLASAHTDWANVDDMEIDDNNDSDDDDTERPNAALKLLSSTTPLLASTTSDLPSSQHWLPPNILGITRKPNANQMYVSQSSVQSVQFYPGDEDDDNLLLFTAGLDKILRFFKILEHGEWSEKNHGINCKRFFC